MVEVDSADAARKLGREEGNMSQRPIFAIAVFASLFLSAGAVMACQYNDASADGTPVSVASTDGSVQTGAPSPATTPSPN